MTNEMEHNLEARVTGLERDVGNLVNAVKALADETHKQQEQIHTTLNAIRQDIGSRSRTNWSTLASWSSVIVLVISTVGALAIYPLRHQVFETEDRLRQHEMTGGHPTALEKVSNLERRYDDADKRHTQKLEQLDLALQREMRDLDAKGQIQIDQLDDRIQREMLTVNADVNASQWERLRALERVVFGKPSDVEFGSTKGSKLEQ